MTQLVEQATTVRLDVWLWAARFFKTRSLAKTAVDNGKVDVAGQRPKPSRAVRQGEQLRID
ncbi:S4 domain-containing protein, partial [Xanthomonas hortorum]